MIARGEKRDFQATVKAKAEIEDGTRVDFDIPAFESKYPIQVKVPAKVATQLKVGEVVAVTLVRESVKRDKDEDSDRLYDFYWGWVSFSPDGAVPEAEAQEKKQPSPGEQIRTNSIERQVALKAAVELAGYNIQAGVEMKSEVVLKVADRFAAWLKAER